MKAYYNENEAYAARWLRNLIAAGLIMEGDVDERSIVEVEAKELSGYGRVHLFAGIGGWDYALRLAGWPADRPVWTGSCPCQPFSCAGKRGGEKDERHLWPEFYRLVSECRPVTIFGEQTASGDGPRWLDGVSLDLEELGYAVGTSDLPAAGVGSPHRRQRLWWMAHAGSERRQQDAGGPSCDETENGTEGRDWRQPNTDHVTERVSPDTGLAKSRRRVRQPEHPKQHGEPQDGPADRDPQGQHADGCGQSGGVGDAERAERGTDRQRLELRCGRKKTTSRSRGPGGASDLGNTDGPGRKELACESQRVAEDGGVGHAEQQCPQEQKGIELARRNIPAGPWSDFGVVWCDERAAGKGFVPRRIEPGTFPMVDGSAYELDSGGPLAGKSRVGTLRGFGNAIVPILAAEFIKACLGIVNQES